MSSPVQHPSSRSGNDLHGRSRGSPRSAEDHQHGAVGASGPISRASTPLARVLNLPEPVRDDLPLESHLGVVNHEDESGEEDGMHATDGCRSAWVDIMPKKADLSEAEQAIAKIERIEAARTQRRKWRKATGAAAVFGSGKSRADGRQRRERRHRESRQDGLGNGRAGSHELSRPGSGLSLDGGDLGGPVKLGINSISGYSILAVREAAGKTRHVVSRAVGPHCFLRARSPTSVFNEEYQEEEEEIGEKDKSTEHARLNDCTLPHARRSTLRGSLAIGRAQREANSPDAQALAATTNADQKDGQARSSGTPARIPREPAAAVAARRVSIPTSEAAIVEEKTTDIAFDKSPSAASDKLGAVEEDQHREEEENAVVKTIMDNDDDAAPSSQACSQRLFISIPFQHVQEPSLQSINTCGPRQLSNSAVKPVATRGALSFDSPLEFDSTNSALHHKLEPARSITNRWILPRDGDGNRDINASPVDANSSASSLSTSNLPSSLGCTPKEHEKYVDTRFATSDREADAESGSSDDGDYDAPFGCLSLEHARPVTNKEMRKQLKRDKVLPRHTVGTATQIGQKVSRGLNYASSESRNRRAMEKYSPYPNAQRTDTAAMKGTGSVRKRTSTAETPISDSLRRVNTLLSTSIEGGWNPSFIFSRSYKATTIGAVPSDASVGELSQGLVDATSGEGSRQLSRVGSLDPLTKSGSPPLERSSVESARDGSLLHRLAPSPSRQFTMRCPPSDDADAQSEMGSHLLAPRPWHFRKRCKWTNRNAEEIFVAPDTSVATSPQFEDPEVVLDSVLGKLAAEEALQNTREKYEWDVLYENQRGIFLFGVPKFSARTLMQWDPSPWTNQYFENSPYNIVNAQLPDPTWEWIYPEFLIDMSGDVDDQGWQYSGDFGRNPFARLHYMLFRPSRIGPSEELEMTARMRKKKERHREKEAKRADDDVEALKRSIKAKDSKWTGRPDAGNFVRRRRWIRLRMRRAMGLSKQRNGAKQAETDTNAHKQDLVDLASTSLSSSSQSTSSLDDDEIDGWGVDEEDQVSSVNCEDDGYTSPCAKSSAFLPKRTAGHLGNGENAAEFRRDARLVRMSQRHRREFTSTLRDLKSLLPSLLEIKPHRSHHRYEPESCRNLALATIDARNPFISWRLISKRLTDDDMSWQTNCLKKRERRHQQRSAGQNKSTPNLHQPMPSAFSARSRAEFLTKDSAGAGSSHSDLREVDQLQAPFPETDGALIDNWELTRDALVEINFVRVKTVLRACKLDRQRLDLWKYWLRLETPACFAASGAERGQNLPHNSSALISPSQTYLGAGALDSRRRFRASSNPNYRPRRKATREDTALGAQHHPTAPDRNDVWDVLEGWLDAALFLFEFNSSRATLLRILLSVHNESHVQHCYRNDQSWKLTDFRGHEVQIRAPSTFDPRLANFGGNEDRNRPNRSGIRDSDWVVGLTARLQFFSDVHSIAEAWEKQRDQRRKPEQGAAGEGQYSRQLSGGLSDRSEYQSLNLPMVPSTRHPTQENSTLSSENRKNRRTEKLPQRGHRSAMNHYRDLGLTFQHDGPDEPSNVRRNGLHRKGDPLASPINQLCWQQHQQHRPSPLDMSWQNRADNGNVDATTALAPSALLVAAKAATPADGDDMSHRKQSPSPRSSSSPSVASPSPSRSRSPLATSQGTARSLGESQAMSDLADIADRAG